MPARSTLGKAAQRLLAALAAGSPAAGEASPVDMEAVVAAELATRQTDGTLAITPTGRAHLARLELARAGTIDPFLGQHLGLARASVETAHGRADMTVDATESPLAWLARRKGRDGRALIEPVQLQAGERLRADFTRAQLMPRTTSNWTSSIAQDRRTAGNLTFSDTVIAARQCVRQALDSAGPEFTGLLIDVCCFLRGLEDVERERAWPPRSAKVVLQLGLDRLARHYGYGAEARGKAHVPVRTWLAQDAAFVVAE